MQEADMRLEAVRSPDRAVEPPQTETILEVTQEANRRLADVRLKMGTIIERLTGNSLPLAGKPDPTKPAGILTQIKEEMELIHTQITSLSGLSNLIDKI